MTIGSRTDDQTSEEVTSIIGVHGGGDEKGRGTEVGVDGDRHAPVGSDAVGAQIQPLDPSLAVEGTVITGGGFGGGSGSGNGDVARDGPPPRDLVRGKGLATETETSREVLPE